VPFCKRKSTSAALPVEQLARNYPRSPAHAVVEKITHMPLDPPPANHTILPFPMPVNQKSPNLEVVLRTGQTRAFRTIGGCARQKRAFATYCSNISSHRGETILVVFQDQLARHARQMQSSVHGSQ